jgi:hypothetical protein
MGTYDPLPVDGDTSWGPDIRTAITGLDKRMLAQEATGKIYLEDFSTGSDDGDLTAALSASAAETYPSTIVLSNVQNTFTTANRDAFSGMRIQGPDGYGNPERLSSTKMPGRVHLNFNGSWFRNPLNSDVYSVSLHNMSFTGGGAAAGPNILGQNGSGTWYCLSMRDIFTSSLRTVLGTQSTKLLITAANFTGDWEVNNCYNGAFHMGGSDNTLWTDGMLLDSGTAFATAGSSNGQYHLWCDSLDKTFIGPLYITAEGAWNGIRVSGPVYNNGATNQGVLWMRGLRVEGRNPGAPCNGALIRVEGGMMNLRDSWIAYGMDSPSTPGHSPTDAGCIHQTAGAVLLDGITYDRVTSQAETVPFAYCNGGQMRVQNIWSASRGGTWAGLPRVDQAAGTVIADASVTVI